MTEPKAPMSQGARKRLNDRFVRRLTVTAAGGALGMTGLFSAIAALPNAGSRTEAAGEPDLSQPSLASAIEDYESAVAATAAARASIATPRPLPLSASPAPAHHKRPPVVVSGGS